MGEAAGRAAFQLRFRMSSREPSPGHAEAAQTVSRDPVTVTGAAFTRVPVPRAPLLVDDFSNDTTEDMVRGPQKHDRQGSLRLLVSRPD